MYKHMDADRRRDEQDSTQSDVNDDYEEVDTNSQSTSQENSANSTTTGWLVYTLLLINGNLAYIVTKRSYNVVFQIR